MPGSDSRTSITLLGRLRQAPADQAAWSEFVERYGRKIYGWCRHWQLQEADAQDVTQDVLLKLAAKMRSFAYDRSGSFRGWLKTLTHHAWQDFIEGRRRAGTGIGDTGGGMGMPAGPRERSVNRGSELMVPNEPDARLTAIDTHWSKLFEAHKTNGETTTAAQQEELLRYYGAVRRYLVGIVHDAALAEELTQDFAVRFLRGDFKRADPERGRFRDFLKTALRHLARDYWRKKELRALPKSCSERFVAPALADDCLDRLFLDRWREALLDRTWDALARLQDRTGQPYHTTLRYKAEHPKARSAELGDHLSACRHIELTPEAIRQLLHRAREKFADLLVDEVARSLGSADPGKLEQELVELDLLDYCRPSLARRAGTV